MTIYDESAGTEDPKSLLEELRQAIEGDDEDTTTLPERLTDAEEWAEQHLRGFELASPGVVSAAADLVIRPQEPAPEARSRMIAAAGRALAERRTMVGLLPVLLRTVREQNGLSTVEVASRAELPEETVRALETGEVAVDLRLPVATVVSWIRSVEADRSSVIAALRRSLRIGWAGDLTLVAGLPDRPESVDDYVNQVIQALAQTP
jgi:DNA-binding XRE family transcriptional regulator